MSLTCEHLFKNLWKQYTSLNPTADKIHQLLKTNNNELLNDHVAFRTFNLPEFGVNHLSNTFKSLGYQAKGEYQFEVKKLYAQHFEHSDKSLPKVFISELLLENFSSFLQDTFKEISSQIPADIKESEGVSYSGRHWDVSHSIYLKLYQESPYAAWLYVFGFCANHFTVYFNSLTKFENLTELNTYLKNNNFTLNSSGGEIKGSPEVYLEQSSTMANEIEVQFSDGLFKVPSCYYEFAKRYPLENGELYQGFVAGSADKIFESTNKLN